MCTVLYIDVSLLSCRPPYMLYRCHYIAMPGLLKHCSVTRLNTIYCHIACSSHSCYEPCA